MSRLVATLLLVLFSFSLVGPVVFAGGQPNLPACCRKSGKHHCLMAGGSLSSGSTGTSSGVTVRAAGEKCPFYLIARALPANGKFTPAVQLASFFRLVESGPYELVSYRTCGLAADRYSLPERGPPSFLS